MVVAVRAAEFGIDQIARGGKALWGWMGTSKLAPGGKPPVAGKPDAGLPKAKSATGKKKAPPKGAPPKEEPVQLTVT